MSARMKGMSREFYLILAMSGQSGAMLPFMRVYATGERSPCTIAPRSSYDSNAN
jgi:hypothetical protein